MFNRNDPFSMEISDSSNKIIKQLVINDELLIFTTDGIYKVLTADEIDSENSYADTRHTHEKLFNIGTSSIYVARMIIQFEYIMKTISFETSNLLISHIWKMNKLLLNCYVPVEYLKKNNEIIKIECNEIIEKYKHNSTIPALPQIEELEAKTKDFFTTGKKFLIELFKIFNLLFQMPLNKGEAHFDNHLTWITENFGKEHSLSVLLNQDINWLRILSECRNAIEHEGDGQCLTLNNFRLSAGNKFSEPTWIYDLSKKRLGISLESSLISDIDDLLHNMLYLFEDIMLIIIQEKMKINNFFHLYKIKEPQLDIDCPFIYAIALKKTVNK